MDINTISTAYEALKEILKEDCRDLRDFTQINKWHEASNIVLSMVEKIKAATELYNNM